MTAAGAWARVTTVEALLGWADDAWPGDGVVYARTAPSGLTDPRHDAIRTAALGLWREGKVALFQRAGGRIAADRRAYDYIAVRISPQAARTLGPTVHG